MITRRTGACGLLLLLAGLALGVLLGGPAGAASGEPGPAYPPAPGGDDVVEVDGASGSSGAGSDATDDDTTARSGEDASDDGTDSTTAESGDDGIDPSDADRPDGEEPETDADADDGIDPSDADRPDTGDDTDGDDEVAADGDGTSDQAAPEDGARGAGPILIVVGTAILLGGGVVAIARRL